jgi:hypothetical protein
MRWRVSVPLVLVIWVVIGLLVASHEGFADFDTGEQALRFLLNVLAWPIPAWGGGVDVTL